VKAITVAVLIAAVIGGLFMPAAAGAQVSNAGTWTDYDEGHFYYGCHASNYVCECELAYIEPVWTPDQYFAPSLSTADLRAIGQIAIGCNVLSSLYG
jgi:hypothetical protein